MARARHDPRAPGHHALTALVVVIALAMAGCTGPPEDEPDVTASDTASDPAQERESTAWLTFEGSGQGAQEDTLDCPSGSAKVRVSGNATGNTTVMVTDGGGVLVWGETLRGDLAHDEVSLTGEPGAWTLEVMRTAAFDGQYTATLTC